MTPSMKKALEILKTHGRLARIRIGYTDWLPIGEAPKWDENRWWRNVCSNENTVQSASIGRLIDAGWAEYEDKTKMRVRFIDRYAPLREAVEIVKRIPNLAEQVCYQCTGYPRDEECHSCKTDDDIKVAEAFLKKYGGTT